MSTLIGSPPVLPDNVSLDTNTSSGKLQLKAGVAGDILFYNGSAWAKLAVGTALQLLRTNAGATAPEWATVPTTKWTTLIDQAAITNTTSYASGALAAYSNYRVTLNIRSVTTNGTIGGRLNSDSGANYYGRHLTSTAVGTYSTATSFTIGESINNYRSLYIIDIQGVTYPAASGGLGICIQASAANASGSQGISATWLGGNGIQVSAIALVMTQNCTGTITIEGANF